MEMGKLACWVAFALVAAWVLASSREASEGETRRLPAASEQAPVQATQAAPSADAWSALRLAP